MIINVNQVITDFSGHAIAGHKQAKDAAGELLFFTDEKGNIQLDEKNNGIPILEPLTLRDACIRVLSEGFMNEQNVTGDEKFKRYEIAKKIYDAQDEVELTAEDITKVKALIGKLYIPLVVGRVYEMLEKLGGTK